MPLSVLGVLAAKADRVLAQRSLAGVPAAMLPYVKHSDAQQMLADLERRAGRKRQRVRRTPLQDLSVAGIAKVLRLDGS